MCIRDRYQRRVHGDNCIKDLSLLGRDLSRTIIVDNLAECFRKQPKNGILVRTWTGDPDDTVLSCLSKLLMNIANQRGDILPYLPNVRDRMLGLIKQLSLIHISEPTRPLYISYAVFCLKKKNQKKDQPQYDQYIRLR
eukprot:TRINITY_DN27229_c0_g1_i2.p2 TRINITY_DN27229_c0_g1~~TRINITY_DN27229_c0_g1_i2.p2  ORF type:complete len:138 (+),score=23.57 TRINITY_DN27229_c0_g1_i2:183-596(+)